MRMHGTERPVSLNLCLNFLNRSYHLQALPIFDLVTKQTARFNIQTFIMTTQTESQTKHHPDDWSFTSNHHHHVERTVHPVIVDLIKWVFTP